jgi:ribosomal protein L12E/L44/L45/RPP1/RPP2
MANLITRLLLETGQFDSTLGRSSAQIRQFEARMNRVGSSVGNVTGSFLKMVPAIGAGMGVVGAFQKTMYSTQNTGDAFAKVIMQAEASVNYFFTSIATGNFSNFKQGLNDTIKYAGDLAEAIDRLGTARITSSGLNSIYDVKISEARLNARKASMAGNVEETKKWNDEEMRLVEKKAKESGRLAGIAYDKAKSQIRSSFHRQKGDVNMLNNLTPEDILGFDKGQAAKDAEYVQGLYDKQKKLNADKNNTAKTDKALKDRDASHAKLKKVNSEIEALTDQQKINYALNQIPDVEMIEYVKSLQEAGGALASANNQFDALMFRHERLNKKAEKGSGKSKTEEILTEGSKAYLDNQIAELEKLLKNETDERLQLAYLKKINALKQELNLVKNNIRWKEFGVQSNDGAKLLPTAKIPDMAPRKVYYDIKSEYLNPKKDIKFKFPIDDSKTFADSLKEINELFGSLSEASARAGDGVDNWATGMLKWASATISACINVIPKIEALSEANRVQALTAQGKAVAEGAASVASVPYAGFALALAAIAALSASFAALPKFADGGIVGGSSFVGDRLLARVNSGEMILNRGQQSGLLAGLNSGAQNVTFTLRGDDLVGAINNHGKKNRRW